MQRCAFYIILGGNYTSYADSLDILEFDTFDDRRVKLCENVAKNALKHPNFKNWFFLNNESQPIFKTRSEETKVRTL